jgi:glucose-1-phosphate thymidylyltransferase
VKIIIPVAGEGRRLRPHTYTTPKALLPVGGKPILGHIVEQVLDLNPSEVIFITGPLGDQVEKYIRSAYSFPSTFIEQATLYGLGYAVHLGIVSTSEDLLIILGDTIVELDWRGLVATGRNTLVVKEVADPRAFGVAETDGDRIVHLVEKPANPPTNLAVVGVYYIKETVRFHECTTEVVNRRVLSHGEIQLTDAFELMLQKGSNLYTFPTLGWYDCGRKESMLSTNRFLLERQSTPIQREGSTIISPSFVAPDARIENSTIGPHASIGKNTVVRNSTVRDSVVFEGALIDSSTINDSLIGNFAVVRNASGSYNLGDHSEVGKLKSS